jgi:cephalosporin hydroxylase
MNEKPRPTLDEIAHREKVPELWTDKKSFTPGGYVCHDYLRFYERELSKWRDEPICFLEIGLNKGASVKLWLEYFTRATVYGVDINEFKNEAGIENLERFIFLQGDQSDEIFWNNNFDLLPRFHVVIDDGCHFSGPIHAAFKCLWPRVKSGGYYIVEDITEVRNPDSHTPGFPDQIQFVEDFIKPVVFGNDIDEMMISKDLCIIRKEK